MTATQTARPVLGEVHAALIQGPVSINAASCDVACVASMVRAAGCRVSPDRRTVTVFIAVAHAANLLRDLQAGRAVAVVFSRPSTHETVQLKAAQAHIQPLAEGDRRLMQEYGRNFIKEVCALGYQESFAKAMLAAVDEEAVGVTFMPAAIFEQTPGPAAGRRLEPEP